MFLKGKVFRVFVLKWQSVLTISRSYEVNLALTYSAYFKWGSRKQKCLLCQPYKAFGDESSSILSLERLPMFWYKDLLYITRVTEKSYWWLIGIVIEMRGFSHLSWLLNEMIHVISIAVLCNKFINSENSGISTL